MSGSRNTLMLTRWERENKAVIQAEAPAVQNTWPALGGCNQPSQSQSTIFFSVPSPNRHLHANFALFHLFIPRLDTSLLMLELHLLHWMMATGPYREPAAQKTGAGLDAAGTQLHKAHQDSRAVFSEARYKQGPHAIYTGPLTEMFGETGQILTIGVRNEGNILNCRCHPSPSITTNLSKIGHWQIQRGCKILHLCIAANLVTRSPRSRASCGPRSGSAVYIYRGF